MRRPHPTPSPCAPTERPCPDHPTQPNILRLSLIRRTSRTSSVNGAFGHQGKAQLVRTLSGVIMVGLILAVAGCGDDGDKDPAASSTGPSVSATAPAPHSPSASAPDPATASAPASGNTTNSATPPAPSTTGRQTTAPTGSTAPSASSGAGSSKTTQGAIARYEEFLHAISREDIDTMCEIAAPAAKLAEDLGFGPCRSTITFQVQMFSSAQKAALRTATVDPSRVSVRGSARVDIPASAVKASVTFTSGDLSDMTLEYLNGNWYITD